MTKLQISLTDQENELLALKAQGLGYDVTRYAKFVLAREAESALNIIPVLKASKTMDNLIENAIREDTAGKTQEWVLK